MHLAELELEAVETTRHWEGLMAIYFVVVGSHAATVAVREEQQH